MMKNLLLVLFSLLFFLPLSAQYSETFSTPNKGYLLSCVNDVTGVNWSLTPWDAAGTCQVADLRDPSDYFNTTVAGVMESIDLDQEVCWESPLMNISTAGTVALSVGLVWNGFDSDVAANSCLTDYIRVFYSVNSGAYVMVPNQFGGNACATISYPFGSSPPATGTGTVTQGGISGTTLKIRVCVFTNVTAELVQIDNVSVPQAGVTIGCAAPVLSNVVTQVGCSNPNSGAINLTVSAGTPPYTYDWSNDGPETPDNDPQDLSGLPVGTYTVTVTDAASCSATSVAIITNAPALSLSTQVLNASCSGVADGEIDLIVSGGVPGYTYDWSNDGPESPDNDAQDLIGVGTGTYTVTVTDASGCTSSTNATIGLLAMTAYNEQFNIANKGYLPNYVDDFSAVNWTMSSWAPEPPAPFGRDVADFFRTSGGILTGEDFDQDICWTSPIIDLNTGTQFSVDLTWTGFDVQVDEYINVKYSIDGGAYVTIPNTVGSGAGTIQYAAGLDQNGSITITKTGLSGGTIQIQICAQFNSNNESMTIDNVSVPNSLGVNCPGPDMSLMSTNVSCNGGSNGTIKVTANNGTSPYNVSWSGPSSGNPAGNEIASSGGMYTITGLVAGTYTVTVTDAALLTATATTTITQPTAIVLSTTQVNVLCNGAATGSIDLTVSGGTPGYTYVWSSGQTTQDRSGLVAGTYTVTVTDANGCTKTSSATITEPLVIALTTVVTNVACNGASTGAIDLTVSGGAPGYTYDWSNDGPESPDNDSQDLTGLVAGTYTVTVTDANNCTKTSSVTITQPSAVVLSTTQVNVLCNAAASGSIDLTVLGGIGVYTYDWSNDGPESPDNDPEDLTGLIAGTYTVTVTDANGCSKTSSATITQPSVIVLTTTQVNVLCNGAATGSIDLTVSGGTPAYTYMWSAGQTTQDLSGLTGGTYTVTVTDANGCTKTSSATISQPPPLVLSTTQVDPTCGGAPTGSIDLTVSGGSPGYTYDWSNDGPETPDNDPQDLSGVASGTYTVTVTDVNGCTKTSSTTLAQASPLAFGDHVYKDNNHNGLFDAGDVGIGNVSLSVYNDVDNNGMLTGADGAAIFLTTTLTSPPASLGLWSVTNVCAGNYLIAVNPANFLPGGALNDMGVALVSSPIGGAPDPDTNIDNDDNGDPVAGFGVATTALTMALGTEPIDDGDADNNTNYSVDFGFKAPTTVTINDLAIAEGTGGSTTAFNFTVTRSDNFEAFSLTVNTMDGTASAFALDYTNIFNGTISFTAGGSLTQTVTVLVNQDNMVEATETFNVLLSSAPPGIIIVDGSGAGIIVNDDIAVVTLSGGASQLEGTSFTFVATLNNPVQGGFSVGYATNNGTATTADLDYTDNDGTIPFAGTAGETHNIIVNSTTDSKVELNETFTVSLGAVTGAPFGNGGSGSSFSGNSSSFGTPVTVSTAGSPQTGTIVNDDQAIISIVPVSMNEGNAGPSIFTFTATLSNAVDVPIGVPYMTSDGTAIDIFTGTGSDDYNSSTGTLNFAGTANETKTFSVQVNGDLIVESNETFNAVLTSIIASGRNVIFMGGTPTLSTTGTIINDDNAVVTLSGGTSVNEGNAGTTPMVFTMTLNNAVQSSFVVNFKSFDGTATTGDNDYIGVDASEIFQGNAGEMRMFTVNIKGDLNIENTEMFTAAITDITGTPMVGTVTAAGSPQTGTILNDELDWGDAPTAAQSGFAGTYPTLTGANGARHQEFPGGLKLGATLDADLDGQPNATATGDGADEDGVVLPASLITGTSANITVTSTGGPGKLDAWVDFNRDGDWADAGEQVYTSTNVVLGPNALSFAVPSGASVGTSFARFRLSTVGGLPVTGSGADGEVEDYLVNILNNSFSIDNPSVVEGNASTTNLVFTVTRTTNSNASSVDYAITGGTATVANNDYQPLAAGTINFLAGGALSQTITVTVNGDLIVEGNETVIITLSNPVAGGIGANPGTGTITNDDNATLVLSGGIAQAEGNGPNVPYVFTVTLNPTVQGGFTVAYTTNDGTATTADNDYIDNDASLVFAGTAGETKTITVNAPGDLKVELNETFTVALGAITNTAAPAGSITISGSPQTGTINNDDAAVVAMLADVTQSESVTPQVFTITLSNPVDVPVTVLFSTAPGTASPADPDYNTISNQTVTFAPNTTTSQTVNVTIINDTKVEDNETYFSSIGMLMAGSPMRNVSMGTTIRTGTINNNDSVNLTLSGGGSAAEGNSGTTGRIFTVTLGPGIQGGFADPDPGSGSVRGSVASVQGGFTVAYSTNDGSGNAATTANNDYIDNDGTLVFLGNANEQKTFTVLGNGDLNIEFDENYTVALGAITGTSAIQAAAINKLGSPQTGVLVNDEKDWGDAPTAAQSGFAGTYPTLMADNGANSTLEIAPFSTRLGATVDADLDGQPSATATGDGADEDGVTLPNAFVINTTATITVSVSGSNGFLTGWIDWNRDGDWDDAGERIIATFPSPSPLGSTNYNIAVPAGASLGTSYARFIQCINPTSGLPPILQSGNGEVEDYQINIVNTQFNIDSPSVLEGNAGPANLVFTISRTNNSTACSVNYAITGGTATTADNDYQVLASGTASFAQGGALSQTVTVVVNGDLKVELNETVIMTLSTPVNGAIQNGTGTGTITNDDSGVITITSPSILEGDAGTQNLVFNINMSAISDSNVDFAWGTINNTATVVDNDYVSDGASFLTLMAGQTSATITIIINGDCKIEANETFFVELSSLFTNGRAITFSPAGGSLTGTGTILNEDFLPVLTFCPANVTINCQDSSAPAATGQATATDDCPGVLVTSADITVGGNCINNYIINRTWKATDNTNDMATCLQVITVRDITPPTISCPGNLTVSCVSQVPFVDVETGFQTSDNCGGVFISYLGDVISNQVCTNRYLITRSYRATDACGNSASCQQLITVFDNTQPTLTCPPPATFQCASDVPQPNAALVSSTDNCGGVASTSFVNDAITNQTCPNKFTLTRTYRATDVCGNSSTCTQVFTVNDNTVPTLTCPGIITVQCATLVPLPITSLVTATDNCSGTPTVTHIADVISNQTCINKYTVTRFYRATDLCGNSASCSQTIIVNDNTLPTLTCPGNVTVQCAALVPAVNTAGVVTADNCGPAPTVTFVSDVISNTTCVNRFIVTRTYRTTDACNNSATCIQVITVFDNTAPTLTCPQNVTVQCAADVPVPNTALVVTADNCSGTPTVTFVNDVISNTTCLNRFIVTRTYRSTDICGNSATCVQIITVFDNTAPLITFTESHIANLPNGGRFDVQCFGQDPMWDLPVLDESSVSVSDNCAGTVTVGFSQLLFDEGNCPVDGYITMYKLTWTATDACGNSSTKFVFMALVDHIGPVLFNIPADITVNCDEVPGLPTDIYATDECISAASIQYSGPPPTPGCQNGQVIIRSWTATDQCGNKTTETQHITLVDVKPPVLQMLQPELAGVTGDITFQYTCEEGGIPDFFDDLNAESVYSQPSCGSGVSIKFDKSQTHAVNCKRAGYLEQQTFHWYAVDICGNATNLTITAQVVDTESPVIEGVPDVACIDDPDLKFVDAIDNCEDPYLQYWDVKIPNPCGAGFAVRRIYEAFDHCGNSSRDTAILIPNDHMGPLMTFVNPKLKDLAPGEVLLIDCEGKAGDYTPYGVDDVSVQDGCSSEVEVTFVEKALSSHGCENGIVASLSLEWTATDICGNVSKLTVPAFVVDHTPPVLVNFKSEVTIGCNDELPAINATDNCGSVTIAIDESTRPGPCEFEYDITRNIVVTDACGNITNATQVVHVGDGSGPVISGVVPLLCGDLSIPDVTAYDPCADKKVDVTMTEKQLDSGCKEGKVFERTWTATDGCGNVSTEVQIIIVDDHTAPVIQIPTWSIILKYLDAAPGTNFVKLSNTDVIDKLNDLDDGSVYVEDECDEQVVPEFTLEVSYADDCVGEGYYEHRIYTWTATDICGNSSSISFDVYIIDDVAPILLGVPADETYICVPLPAQAVVTSDDPAQPVTIVISSSIAPGSDPGEFDIERTWIATDACGNVTIATQHITWIPDTFLECDVLTPPQVECNSHGVVISSLVTGGLGGYTYEWSVVGPGFIQSGQGTDQITIYVGWTTVTIHLTVRDAYGCETECSAVIDCIDTAINPFADTPPAVTPETVPEQGFESTNDQNSGGRLSELTLWPNPTNSSVNLSFDSHAEQEVNFRLVNFLGQDMLNDKINALKGYNTQKIDVTGISEGSYLMEVKTDSGVYTKVVVIMRK